MFHISKACGKTSVLRSSLGVVLGTPPNCGTGHGFWGQHLRDMASFATSPLSRPRTSPKEGRATSLECDLHLAMPWGWRSATGTILSASILFISRQQGRKTMKNACVALSTTFSGSGVILLYLSLNASVYQVSNDSSQKTPPLLYTDPAVCPPDRSHTGFNFIGLQLLV